MAEWQARRSSALGTRPAAVSGSNDRRQGHRTRAPALGGCASDRGHSDSGINYHGYGGNGAVSPYEANGLVVRHLRARCSTYSHAARAALLLLLGSPSSRAASAALLLGSPSHGRCFVYLTSLWPDFSETHRNITGYILTPNYTSAVLGLLFRNTQKQNRV